MTTNDETTRTPRDEAAFPPERRGATRRSEEMTPESLSRLLARWFVTLELVGIVGLVLALLTMRACA